MTDAELRETLSQALELVRRLGQFLDVVEDPGAFGVVAYYPDETERRLRQWKAFVETFDAAPNDGRVSKAELRDVFTQELRKVGRVMDDDDVAEENIRIDFTGTEADDLRTSVETLCEDVRAACLLDRALDEAVRPGAVRG